MARHSPMKSSGLFPTPHANCATGPGGQGRAGGLNLQTATSMLPPLTGGERERERERESTLQDHSTAEWWICPDGTDYSEAIHRWETVLQRPAPPATEIAVTSKQGRRLSPVFVEWMMGLDPGWVTGFGFKRNAVLRMLGNGVVPQQGAQALRELLEIRAGHCSQR